FVLAGFGGNGGERTEGCSSTGAAGEQGVTHAIEGGTILGGETYADGVGAVVDDDGCGGRLAFQDSSSVNGDLLRRESGAGGNDRIDLIGYGRTADGVLDAVEDVHNVREFLNGVGDAGGACDEQFRVLRK